MPWQEPKTDWEPTDCYNADDMNRVETNTLHLASIADVFRRPVLLEPVVTDRMLKSIEFAFSLNRVERNIEQLHDALYTPVGWEMPRTDWAALKQSFTYRDATRLEANLLRLHILAQAILAEQPWCGTFSCGEEMIL